MKWRMILAVVNTIYTIVQWLCTGKPKRIQDFNGVWTRDLAILVWYPNQLSHEAIDVGNS